NNEFHQHINEEDLGDKYDSEEEGVPETVFGSNASSYRKVDDDKGIFHSEDPFGIYKILNNKNRASSPSLSHPPGFTPKESDNIAESANDFGEHAKSDNI
nr:RNA-directed DNA polymerase, eukaryota [Tanacetum cinerariifolium]